MPPGLPPRPPPPPAPAVAVRGRSPPSLSPPRSRSRDLPSILEDPVSPPWQWPQTARRDASMGQAVPGPRSRSRSSNGVPPPPAAPSISPPREAKPVLRLQGSKGGRSSTPKCAIPPTPSKRVSQFPLPTTSSSSTGPMQTPILPLLDPEDQEDDEEEGPPGLDEESEDEDDRDTLDYGSDAGGIHEDRDQAHDHYVEA